MPRGTVGTAYRYFFTVQDLNGDPATGVSSGDFTVTVRNPQNTAESELGVTESGLLGLYFFDVPGAFSTSHGVGEYGVLITVNSSSPAVRDIAADIVEFVLAEDLSLIRKFQTNRITTQGLGTGTTTQTLYDDDDTTPILQWTLTTDGGEDVLTSPGIQTNRSQGI